MTRDSSGMRWLGLEIGSHRYAVDLRVVSNVLVWPQTVADPVIGLNNAQGLLLHDGQPVVVVGPQQVFTEVSSDATPLQVTDSESVSARPVNAWLVIFRSAPGVAAHGLRVDRTVGPFRAGEVGHVAAADHPEIDYAGHRWRVVQINPMHATPSSNRTAEEALP